MILSALLVFVFALAITFLNIRERDAWIVANIRRSLLIEALVEAAIVASILLVVHYSWLMLVPSVSGAVLGRWLAWRF